MRLEDLDPSARCYGRRNSEYGTVFDCSQSLEEVRRKYIHSNPPPRDSYDIVAWVNGEHVVIPDSWPGPCGEVAELGGCTYVCNRDTGHSNYWHEQTCDGKTDASWRHSDEEEKLNG